MGDVARVGAAVTSSNHHSPWLPWTTILTFTSLPVPAAVGAAAAFVTTHVSAAVLCANSVPLAATLLLRIAACCHGALPSAWMSSASAVQRAASTTVSKRTVASNWKSRRCGPNVMRLCCELLAETPTRRPFAMLHAPSTALKPSGTAAPSKLSVRTVTGAAAAAAGSAPAIPPTAASAPMRAAILRLDMRLL